MLKPEELRIGNIVRTSSSKPLPIFGIFGDTIWLDCGKYQVDETVESIEPIPIAEEWLLKFGFIVRNNIDDLYEKLHENNLGYVISLTKSGKYDFHFPSLYAGEITIQYAHQLQNLYFALTGTELTIKEI